MLVNERRIIYLQSRVNKRQENELLEEENERKRTQPHSTLCLLELGLVELFYGLFSFLDSVKRQEERTFTVELLHSLSNPSFFHYLPFPIFPLLVH